MRKYFLLIIFLLITFSFGVFAQNRTGCCSNDLDQKKLESIQKQIVDEVNRSWSKPNFKNFSEVYLTILWLNQKHKYNSKKESAPLCLGNTEYTNVTSQEQLKKIITPNLRVLMIDYININNTPTNDPDRIEVGNASKVLFNIISDEDYQ